MIKVKIPEKNSFYAASVAVSFYFYPRVPNELSKYNLSSIFTYQYQNSLSILAFDIQCRQSETESTQSNLRTILHVDFPADENRFAFIFLSR